MDTMTEQDWEDIDKNSRDLLSCFLETKLSATAVGESHGNCCWDLSCMINDKSVSLEIKERHIPHDRYSDIMIEEIKAEATAKKKQFKVNLVANVHSDNVICLARMDDKDAKHQTRMCRRTTLVKGALQDWVQKDVVFLPQRLKVKFRVENGKLVFNKYVK